MDTNISISNRRIGVLINFISLFLLIFVFELINHDVGLGLTLGLILIGIFFVIVIASFIYVYGKTGLWKLSHQHIKLLDERQVQVLSNALRISYSAFVIIVLIIIYGYALIKRGPIDVVIAGALIYMAHILPASILAWTEKEV